MSGKIDFQSLSFGMRRIGWIRFWVQSILGVVVMAVLIFSNFVSDSEDKFNLNTGLSLTTISFILLLFSIWQGWLIIRTGRAIASNARPSRGQTSKLIKRGLLNDLLGILFGLIGNQTLIGILFLQSTSEKNVVGSINSNYDVTGLEIFSVLSNCQVIFAHFLGLCFSLWLLRRIYK